MTCATRFSLVRTSCEHLQYLIEYSTESFESATHAEKNIHNTTMASLDLTTILNALQAYQRREARQPNNRAVKQYLLNKGVSESVAWSNSFNELCYWTEKELDDLFHDLQLPGNVPLDKLISFLPRPQGRADPAPVFIKPSLESIQQSASQLGALCVNRQGDFSINPKEGFAALSHVWSQGLGADHDNRGLDASLLHQVFDRVEPLGVQWIWTDSLAIPGGKRALNLVEEELKGQLINAMADIYRQADFVVVLDALCLRLNSTDPVKVAAVMSLGGECLDLNVNALTDDYSLDDQNVDLSRDQASQQPHRRDGLWLCDIC